MTGFSKPKRKFDQRLLEELRNKDPKAEPLSSYCLHDLRRTARTLMSRAGVDRHHAERCLGHVLPGIEAVYDQHKYHAEMQKAYDALALMIERIVNPPPDNIVPFPQAAGEND
jgi:integrase